MRMRCHAFDGPASAIGRGIGRARRSLFYSAALLGLVAASDAAADDRDKCRDEEGKAAIIACSRVIESGKLRGHVLAVQYVNRGVAYHTTGDLDRAIKDYTASIQNDPAYTLALYNRALAYTVVRETDRAIQDYGQVLKLDPNDRNALTNRCGLYADIGENELAVKDCSQAIKVNPEGVDAFLFRAFAHYNKGKYDSAEFDSAIKDYSEAIRINPGTAAAFFARAVIRVTVKNAYNEALQDFSEAIRLDPTQSTYWNGRCAVRAILGQLNEALADCNESMRLKPEKPDLDEVFDSSGFTYLKLGNLDDSLADYDEALRLNPKRADSLYGRGLAKLKKGDVAGGNADIEAAKAIQPEIVKKFALYGVK